MVMTIKRGASKSLIQTILNRLAKEKKSKGVNTLQFVGKINLKENPLTIQKALRNEWE